MAFIFGFDVDLLGLLVVFEVILLVALGALFYELRNLKKLIDEVLEIEKIHSQEKVKVKTGLDQIM